MSDILEQIRAARELLEAAERAALSGADRQVKYEDACDFLGISESLLREIVARGELPVIDYGTSKRFCMADLRAFRDRCRKTAAA